MDNYIKKINLKNILYLLRLFCKYYIAYYLFSYAFAKILDTQFGLGYTSEDDNISSFNGFMLTWYYYGYSKVYGLVIAGTQMLAGILILFRKTERIGIITLLSFMVNILLVNIFYQIASDAMYMALTLTLMGLFLLISDWYGFTSYFLKFKLSKITKESHLSIFLKKYYWINFLIIPILLFLRFSYINNIKTEYYKTDELSGIWEVSHYDPNQKIFKLYFDRAEYIKIKDLGNKDYFGNYTANDSLKVISYNVKHYSQIGSFMVSDSLKKMKLPKDSIKTYKQKITNHYNKKMEVIDFKAKYNYTIKNDTLILKDSIGNKYSFINVTEKYEKGP